MSQDSNFADAFVQLYHTARQQNDINTLNLLSTKFGSDRMAEIATYYDEVMSGGGANAGSKFDTAISNLETYAVKLTTAPRPKPRTSAAEVFMLGAQKSLQDMARTAELRQKEALSNFVPQAAVDARTLANEQLVSDSMYRDQVSKHPIAAQIGEATSLASLGAAAGTSLPSSIASGAAIGALQPRSDPVTGSILGALLGGAGYGVSVVGTKAGGALARNVRRLRTPSTSEFTQARQVMRNLGIPEVTSNISPSDAQVVATAGLKSTLGVDDLSQAGLNAARRSIGKDIGDHYRQSNIPVPDSLADDLDSILLNVKSETGEIPLPLQVQANKVLDIVTDVSNPNRGQALHVVRQKIDKISGGNIDAQTRDGYRSLKQYIDDLALTGLPHGDAVILRGLQKQFGMVSDIADSRVVDSVTGEADLNKLQKVGDKHLRMYGDDRLYNLAVGSRAGQGLHDVAYSVESSPTLQAMGRSTLPYSGWSLIRPVQSALTQYRAYPIQAAGPLGTGAALSALPFIRSEE